MSSKYVPTQEKGRLEMTFKDRVYVFLPLELKNKALKFLHRLPEVSYQGYQIKALSFEM